MNCCSALPSAHTPGGRGGAAERVGSRRIRREYRDAKKFRRRVGRSGRGSPGAGGHGRGLLPPALTREEERRREGEGRGQRPALSHEDNAFPTRNQGGRWRERTSVFGTGGRWEAPPACPASPPLRPTPLPSVFPHHVNTSPGVNLEQWRPPRGGEKATTKWGICKIPICRGGGRVVRRGAHAPSQPPRPSERPIQAACCAPPAPGVRAGSAVCLPIHIAIHIPIHSPAGPRSPHSPRAELRPRSRSAPLPAGTGLLGLRLPTGAPGPRPGPAPFFCFRTVSPAL
ncbi:uncharacterized protein LOC135447369 [Zonotrichia leucophrys gambelii]|uniref:uncharacterized protein LOC135447369 n=1 Tax=Zonotrichia leucophrys gambelii TaxID=257770 RepID=UPI0031404A0C